MNSAVPAYSLLLLILSLAMLPSMLLGLWDSSPDSIVFLTCILLTLFCSITLYLANRGRTWKNMAHWDVLVMIVISWILLCIFGSLPFIYGTASLDIADAFFETTSGLTTTGATVLDNMSALSRATLLWRSMLQWLGGAGVIVMTLLLFPLLHIGGLQIFQQTFIDPSTTARHKTSTILLSIFVLYMIFSILCSWSYIASGLSVFDAINHAMTTVSTGGFSTHDSSIGTFSSLAVELTAIVFMLLCSLPFMVLVRASFGDVSLLWKDTQIRWFFALLLCVLTTLFFIRYIVTGSFLNSLRESAFNGISMMTGTGYATHDFALWGFASDMIILLAMMMGGCSGSTTCGIKSFRVAILFSLLKNTLLHMSNPRRIWTSFYHGHLLEEKVVLSILTFMCFYILTIAFVAVMLNILGMDTTHAISGAISAVSNVGPGLGPIGPLQTWSSIHDAGKWILSFAMLAGRLEMSIVVVFLSLFLRR